MHFEVLVEDQSGEKTLNILVPKIIGNYHTSRIKALQENLTHPKGSEVGRGRKQASPA